MQDHGRGLQPIAYLSKKLHGAELNFPIHDKEALAIVLVFKAWRCYLEGDKTTIYTNHCSLKYLKSEPLLSRRQVRCKEEFREDFGTELCPTPTDSDGVSRRTVRGTFREQQDVSRDSKVLLLARDGSRRAAVRHLMGYVPAYEEWQAEKSRVTSASTRTGAAMAGC
ncbi:unnamed protein product [Closterium sp. NIES-53]